MSGLFVTGTGTDIGKSWVSAWLVRSWQADYWKPIQTGGAAHSDAALIARVAPDALIHPSRHTFPDPLSPHAAAAHVGLRIDLADFDLPDSGPRPLIVEGAGGVLVPLNEQHLMIDLIARLGLPTVIVAASGLGTINHSLLTIAALRHRHIPIAGLIFNGPANPENQAAIEHFSGLPVVATLPPLSNEQALAALPPIAWSFPETPQHG